jgi:hypothetical protein
MAFEAWVTVGHRLSEIAEASGWWLGDWLVYGERTYGDRYRVALRATPLGYQTLRNYAWVARRVPAARRRNVSLQHHAEVAALPEPEQDLWLTRAERSGWSRNELRRRLVETRRGRRLDGGGPTVVCRLEVSAADEQRWRDAAAASGRPLPEWMIAVVDAAARAALPAGPPQPSGEDFPTISRSVEARSLQPEPVAR